MTSHRCTVFKNSCLKTPVNPENHFPTPSYERKKRIYKSNSNENKRTKDKSEKTSNGTKSNLDSDGKKSISPDNYSFMSLIDFYESIPDYKDVNHLTANEFYNKLDTLKRKQKELTGKCSNVHVIKNEINGNENFISESINMDNEISHIGTPDLYKSSMVIKGYNNNTNIYNSNRDINNMSPFSWNKCFNPKKSSMKSVRISSAKSETTPSLKSGISRHQLSDHDLNDIYTIKSERSKSASPIRSTAYITVPKPFKLTQREEDERIYNDLIIDSKILEMPNTKKNSKSAAIIKANSVPITSKIPLYNQIIAEQEHRSNLAKLSSAIELQAQMKPFTFTEREPRISTRCLSRSMSSPHLARSESLGSDSQDRPATNLFKAKPCPKTLNSNYFYHKMWEADYFRALNRKIRAEELLKASSLPPAMAQREKKHKKVREHCSRQSSVNSTGSSRKSKRKKRIKKRIPDYHQMHEKIKCKLLDKHNEFITTSPDPFNFETDKRSRNRSVKSSASNSTHCSTNYHNSPVPIYPVNRPNLAATLRTESCKTKLRELSDRKELFIPREIVPKRDWGVRKTPAWKSLYFDATHDEDLSLRLATRRAEQKMREEEFSINMELMRQRVRAAPLLLEGPTQWGPRVGQVSHRCASISPEIPPPKSSKPRPSSYQHQHRNTSKLSNYSNYKESVKSIGSSLKHDETADLDSIDTDIL